MEKGEIMTAPPTLECDSEGGERLAENLKGRQGGGQKVTREILSALG